MYINDLGISRVTSAANRNNITKTAGTASENSTKSYATVMKNVIDSQKTMWNLARAGDIIIKEAFEKMETDPEWEKSVMNKVKEYYGGNNASDYTQNSYRNWMEQNVLQNYMMQSLLGGQSGLAMSGYSSYGLGNLTASSYGNVINSGISSSIFGNWEL